MMSERSVPEAKRSCVQAQMPLPIQHGALQSTTLVLPGESGGSEWKRNGQEASAAPAVRNGPRREPCGLEKAVTSYAQVNS